MVRLKLHLHGVEIQEINLESGREYTFGRGDSCDIQLLEGTGISRVHFRLVEDKGQWTAQVVSKFGSIMSAGSPTNHLQLEIGSAFKLGPYDFSFQEIAREQAIPESQYESQALPVAVGQSHMADDSSHQPHSHKQNQSSAQADQQPDSTFDGDDEATRVASFEPEIPYLRIIEGSRRNEEIKLEGRRWIAGREEACQILINDRKASRRQFELSSTPQGYFIRDLGSSNGTQLNGLQLAHDELKAIRSGDVIQVGAAMIHFEVRDPHFNTKLMVIPQAKQNGNDLVVQNPYEMIDYPVVQSPGGAIRLDGKHLQNAYDQLQIPNPYLSQNDEKKKKIRFYIIAGLILGVVALVLSLSGGNNGKKQTKIENVEFSKLSPQQQQQVKETFVLAKNLYMQQKLALAGSQLERLHKIIPSGYENSLAMAQDCLAQKEAEEEVAKLQREKQRQEEIRNIVDSTVKKCDPISRRSTSVQEISTCLRPALELDPENSLIRELVSRVQARVDQEEIARKNKEDYRKRVAQGTFLYRTAFKFEEQGEFLDALDAYKKHAESPYPDPEGLKKLSHQQIFSISKRLTAKVEDTLRAAEAAYAVGNFKEALDLCARAIKMDPMSTVAHERNGKYRNELKTRLREIYEASIISEGLGQIDDAKNHWNKIVGLDTTDGEYYKKARNKLRAYGAFGN